MVQLRDFPVADGKSRDALVDRPTRRFRQVAALSAFLGLVSGIGEGVIDFAVMHSSPPAILYVTVVGNLMAFFVFGLALWVLGLGLRPQPASLLVLFIQFWMLLHAWEREFTLDKEHSLLWLLTFIGTALMALLLSLLAWKHEQKIARTLDQALPWILGTALACVAGILLHHPEVEHRAMSIATKAAESSPNVILIIVDALRADHLSCYDYERLTSPNLDLLAKKGVLFENAISTSSWSLPSHASMLTGLYPNQHRAQRFRDQLSADVPTITEELERVGYRTGAFSSSNFFTPRQGLGRGFNEFADFSFSPTFAFTRVHFIRSLTKDMRMTGWVDENIEQAPLVDTDKYIIEWIDRKKQPFFLAINYFEVHQPKVLPQLWRQHFSGGQRSDSRISGESMHTVSQLTPQIQKMVDEYDGAIAYDDDRVQKLVDELSRRHLLNNTLLILTADHGEGLGEHGLMTHGDALYYPLIHVPLIFYWSDHLPSGLRVKQPVSAKDIPATILELLGTSHSKLPGKALDSLWAGQIPPEPWPMPLSELEGDRMRFGRSPIHHWEIESIVSSEFQLILDPREGPSLYNWQADPQERDNLFHAPGYRAVDKELAAELKRSE